MRRGREAAELVGRRQLRVDDEDGQKQWLRAIHRKVADAGIEAERLDRLIRAIIAHGKAAKGRALRARQRAERDQLLKEAHAEHARWHRQLDGRKCDLTGKCSAADTEPGRSILLTHAAFCGIVKNHVDASRNRYTLVNAETASKGAAIDTLRRAKLTFPEIAFLRLLAEQSDTLPIDLAELERAHGAVRTAHKEHRQKLKGKV